jgi:lipopolysaccharide heptosyltransferase I
MRILIIKPSSLGDVVHALPTVNLIRKKFPDATITWLINDNLASLLKKGCPVIDGLIAFPRREFGKFWQLPRVLTFMRRLRAENFDIVIDLQGLLRSGLMTRATRAPRRIGLSDAREGSRVFYNEIVEVPRIHAVDRYLQAAHHLGCDISSVEFPLNSIPSDVSYVDGLVPKSGALIAVNPSARWDTKLWGDDKFAALLKQLPRDRVVLTGSAEDATRIEKLSQGCTNLAGKTDLAQLAEVYRRCAVVITNDSGPMHLAAAVGTPVVAVFGPTDPALTGPYGKRHVVLRSGIPCSPCMKLYCTHTPRMECMKLLTVEQVLAAAQPFL